MKLEKTYTEPVYTLTLDKKNFDILLEFMGMTSDDVVREAVGHNDYKGWSYEFYKVLADEE